MKEKITQLPHWCITDLQPAFYDTDSLTVVEQTGKVYAKVRELVDIYNNFVDAVNKEIEEFENGTNHSIEVFQTGIRQEFQDFIDIVNLQIKDQDVVIQNAVDYMKTNLVQTITNLISEMRESGEFDEVVLNAMDKAGERLTALENTAIIHYDTLETMKGDIELQDGDIVKTLGYYEPNDCGGATYLIREKQETDIEDNGSIHFIGENLVAELIIENGIVNVKSFGAYGNGETDDSSFIQKAISYAKSKEYELFIDESIYLISNTLVLDKDFLKLTCKGTLKSSSNITVLDITGVHLNVDINKILNSGNIGTAVLLRGHNWNSNYKFGKIEGFEYGLKMNTLLSSAKGIQYCNFYFDYINCKYDIYGEATDNGWINQNFFYGGQSSGVNGVTFIKGEGQTDPYNGNAFYNLGFEGNTRPIYLEFARKNTFSNFRLEEPASGEKWIILKDCMQNVFDSAITSLTFDKISDNATFRNDYKNVSNNYKIRCGNDSSYSILTRDFNILNNLGFINDLLKSHHKYLNDSYNTINDPLACYKYFKIDTNQTNIIINLDERYNAHNSNYANIIVKIGYRQSGVNVVINDNTGSTIFDLSTLTQEVGSINQVYEIKLLDDGVTRIIHKLI